MDTKINVYKSSREQQLVNSILQEISNTNYSLIERCGDTIYIELNKGALEYDSINLYLDNKGIIKIDATHGKRYYENFSIEAEVDPRYYMRANNNVGVGVKNLAEYIDSQIERDKIHLLEPDMVDGFYKFSTEIEFIEPYFNTLVASYALDVNINESGSFDIYMWDDHGYEFGTEYYPSQSPHVENRPEWFEYCKALADKNNNQ